MTGIDDHELAGLVGLSLLPGIGPATLARCRAEGGAAPHWDDVRRGRARARPALGPVLRRVADEADVAAALLAGAAGDLDPVAIVARHRAAGHHVLVPGEPGFPARLVDDPEGPAVLFADGDLGALDRRTVAIVGTRNATRNGCALAGELGRGLARAGVAVVSGLALGIDGAAHQAVVDLHVAPGRPDDVGPPIGVIASGLDIAYPRRHRDLHRDVADHGLLLTETPLGGRPERWRFPARNRLIAGLAEAVVVVESRSVGGSMLTAAEALRRGVTVLAVPGHPTSPAAAGANDLLFDGAGPVRDVDDVLGALGLAGSGAAPERRPAPKLEPDHASVLDAIGVEPRALGEVLVASGLTLDRASVALAELEAAGLVVRSGTFYERTPGAPAPRR